jgi:NRPS condensation-like uncharacterized protein
MEYPLTFVQEGRLISEEYRWNIGRRIIPFTVDTTLLLEGSLNIAALEQSLNLVIDRHAGLRAAFMRAGNYSSAEREIKISNLIGSDCLDSGLYAQYPVDSAPLQIKLHFIESLDPEEQEIEINGILERARATPFDYTRPPFIHAHLFQLSCDRHLLILIIDHFVCDMNGLHLLVGELGIFYDSLISQSSRSLPVLKRNFLDFALEQNLQAKNNGFDDAIHYWRGQLTKFWPAQPNLDDLKPLLLKSTDPNPKQSDMGAEVLPLSADDLGRWKGYAKKKKISLNMLFIAACMIIFKKYSGKNDAVALWSNLANVTDPDYMNAIGSYVNTHILGIELSDSSTINEVLLSVRTCVLNAIKNQSAPLSLVMSKPEPLSALNNGFQILCDAILSGKSSAPRYRSNYITIKQAPRPESLMGGIIGGLTVRLSHYGTDGMLIVSFPKKKLESDRVFRMLEEIKYLISWCMENEMDVLANYKLLNSE